jgi:hypothetical protein
MADDGTVLGNLPRSRPGRRSEKRATASAAKAAGRAEREDSPAAKPPPGAGDAVAPDADSTKRARRVAPDAERPRGARRVAPDAEQAGDARRAEPESDPVGDVIRTAAKLAGTGVRVAGTVTQEIVRRIPRP